MGGGTGNSGEGQSQSTTYIHLKMSIFNKYDVQLSTHNEKKSKNCFKNTDTTNRHKLLTKGIKVTYNKTYEA